MLPSIANNKSVDEQSKYVVLYQLKSHNAYLESFRLCLTTMAIMIAMGILYLIKNCIYCLIFWSIALTCITCFGNVCC